MDHASWIEINRDAILHNISSLKKLINNRHLALVVKGNAYGHGALCISRIADQSDMVDFLCTATLQEALALVHNKIKKPILVLGIIDADLHAAAHTSISFLVSELDTIYQLQCVGMNTQHIFDIHLKIDTGLSRLGAWPEHVANIVHKIKNYSHIRLVGLCTHFTQPFIDDPAYAKLQWQRFYNVIQNFTIPFSFIHAANSAGALISECENTNLFRIGLSFYGLWPSQKIQTLAQQHAPWLALKPAFSWKTRIMLCKEVPANTPVGYACSFVTTKTTRIAVLPVGYADGYDFRLSNKGLVLINGQLAPIIGRICMNMCMVDVTDIPGATTGTLVTLVTDHPGISLKDISTLLGYDNVRIFLATLASHLPRIEVTQQI